MEMKTNATGATDARSAVLSKQPHVKSAAVVLGAFGKVGSAMNGNSVPASIAKSYYPHPAEVVKDGTPVASGEDWFKVAAFIHLSPDAYQRVMTALDREASND